MKGHPQQYAQSRLVVIAMALGSVSTLSLAQAQSAEQSPVRFSPNEAPSAAGEMYLLRRAGLLPALPQGAIGKASAAPSPAHGRRPGTDATVNNPAEDTDDRTTQSETTLAVRGKTICAGYNDSGPGTLSGFSRSTNLGTTWTDQGSIDQSGDPVLAVSQNTGTFYYAEIATIAGRPAIGVARSTDDCQSFAAAVDASSIASGLADTDVNDKPWIAVDNTKGGRDGNIYACWTRFTTTGNGSELRFSRSIDGGATYQDEQVLTPNGTAPFGCSVGVGPGGEVYVAWADRVGANDIRFRRSTDGGLNFDPAVTVATGNRLPGVDKPVNCGAAAGDTRFTLNGDIRMLHQAWLAVDTTGGPSNGNIYVTWASDPVGIRDNSDVFFSRSTDGGATWNAKGQLGAGGGATDQFEPFPAVGGDGALSVAWYDRRLDQANNSLIDVFKTISTDGGATFGPLTRVTDVSFPVPPINPNFDPGILNCYMGEYIAVAADAKNFYYLWGDNRNTLVTAAFPGGRPDPDVFFDSQRAPQIRHNALSQRGVLP
jgi:hypothetical protein